VNPARLILPALRAASDGSFAHESEAIESALELGVGGFIVFGGEAGSVRALTADLVRRAGRPLLLGSDLERGAGQQVAGLPELPPPGALGWLDDPDVVRWAGAVTAAAARSVGINWVFAPVADLDALPTNPIVQTRAFGADPAAVAECVRGWIEGCEGAGALACAKHYPGHGRTAVDSHVALPSVTASEATLAAEDEQPFAGAVAAGVASVMTAHVAFPALDPDGRPATLSPPILARLRRRLGFDGIVVTDALIMEGALSGRAEGSAAIEALNAGVDVLLYPKDPTAVRAALAEAVHAGRLPAERLAEAQRRYDAALARAARATTPPPAGPYQTTEELADALLDRGLIRGKARRLARPMELIVVDDDVGGPYPPSPADYLARRLNERGLLGSGGSRIVLAFAEPRAWKGRAGFGAEARTVLVREAPKSDLVLLFAHPRLAAEISGAAPILLAWHRQRLMQEAGARWIAARTA
jgi:beta-glucosidase-like glycosyl hydrolase